MPSLPQTTPALARRIADAGAAFERASSEVEAKLRTCLFDLIGCAVEAGDLPWSRQARELAILSRGEATLIGDARRTSAADAAFANAVAGHGLVREDMHSGSISHLGIVVLPSLLALSQVRPVSGRDFIAAAVVGYEVGACVGRAVMDPALARVHRPTGITGPLAAAAAGARLWRLPGSQAASAIALGANLTAGFNEWAHTGGSEMYFQPGFAARNAVGAVQLAASGAFASPTALEGRAGLFAALGKPAAGEGLRLFAAEPEILAVYHKPVPACNFAQTPAQAALALARGGRCAPGQITAVRVRVSRAAAQYPGCDCSGPFDNVLQAKMSIQYNVAQALLRGTVDEQGFERLDDPVLQRLVGRTVLAEDDAFTAAYPRLQGAQVTVCLADGSEQTAQLDDVVHANDSEVRARFRAAVAARLGATRCAEIEAVIDRLADEPDAGCLARLLGASDNNPTKTIPQETHAAPDTPTTQAARQ